MYEKKELLSLEERTDPDHEAPNKNKWVDAVIAVPVVGGLCYGCYLGVMSLYHTTLQPTFFQITSNIYEYLNIS